MNPFLVTLVVLVVLAAVFFGVSLVLAWLVPLAFPALSFGYGNAMALTGILMLLNVPGLLSK